MKYIIAALAFVGLVAVAEAKPVTYTYDFHTTFIMTEKENIPACIVVAKNNKLVTPYACTTAIKVFADVIRKKDPAAILDFAIDGLELSKS